MQVKPRALSATWRTVQNCRRPVGLKSKQCYGGVPYAAVMSARQRLHWFVLHGVIRTAMSVGARRGDPQGRLIADPSVRADPGRFADELREVGPLVRGRRAWLTTDHALAHQVLRSDDLSVTAIGKALPGPLAWSEERLRVKHQMHPLLAPSLLSVEPPTTPATARPCPRSSRPERLAHSRNASSWRPWHSSTASTLK